MKGLIYKTCIKNKKMTDSSTRGTKGIMNIELRNIESRSEFGTSRCSVGWRHARSATLPSTGSGQAGQALRRAFYLMGGMRGEFN